MRIPIDRQSAVPLYQQVEGYLRESIQTGNLEPGTRLPATRRLAQDLGLSRVTVGNAYALLEADGLIASRRGSGTYVLPREAFVPRPGGGWQAHWPPWQQGLQNGIHSNLAASAESNALAANLIAFTGFGDARRFPIRDFHKAMKAVLRRDDTAALELGDAEGYPPLRAMIAQVLSNQGVRAHPEHILITAGSQQALALVTQTLLKPGDRVLVETPTYDQALDLFRVHELGISGCPIDEDGLRVDMLEMLLQQQKPKLIYTIPTFQNPSGACLSTARRRQLITLACRYNIPILEDDFVGDLRYDGHAQPALKALDSNGMVIYVGTFSKMLMPGLRVGFLAAEGPMYARLAQLKRVTTLATPTLIQRALEMYVTVGRYQAHIRRSCQVYRRRRDAMLAAIQRFLPSEVQLIEPQGGLFIWLRLPEGVAAQRLLPLALAAGVSYAPGTRFFPVAAEGEAYLRLNFAVQPPEVIEEGIRRLRRAIDQLRHTAGDTRR